MSSTHSSMDSLKPPRDMSAATLASGHGARSGPHRNTRPLLRRRGVLGALERATLHTIPAFFGMTMGTGIASILLHNFPYPGHWLQMCGTIVFVLNVVLFVTLLAFTIARYICWRGVWTVVLKHNVSGMFWGCLPMGFCTIINMICFVCVPVWGRTWAYIAYGFWWVDIIVGVGCNFGMVFVLFTRQSQTEKTLAPTWLLPIVSSVVAAATGAVVSQTLMPFNAALARSTILASYVVWGTGVPLAMMVIALIVYRIAIHGPPAGGALASVFLPLGPCGQGSYGIITMGAVARKLAYEYNMPMVPGLGTDAEGMRRIADAMYAGGLVVGLVLWGLALLWYTIGVALFLDSWRRDWSLLGPNKFAVGLWALTFPLGVFATSTIALATELHSPAFKVIGAFLATQVILHFLFVSFGTLWKVIDGTLFAAPELAGIEDEEHDGECAVRRRRSPSPPNLRARWVGDEKDDNVEAGLQRTN